ncbi:RdgB/HAM1 family non-canonical purine NTP pyrophosphatase [Weeksella virosa]|uniref:dITP/XTP pyrophosphatase n=1 Tax=Weeksella virosa (strain ATCC 43766 / DSM 16922 / JCM 21250 / CCUG 30538 / CDC 9751 / IAM 14551 / NBRC 16016 / NCTC 11634 / CL345/78) TaxID=865938 RepID=F0NZ70_WEEVC|nr:RdgB/HAM1 family non-canonical purine NTP pyrophosphatase [Weeksella virosa]ADX68287.1 Nucleoside-triphosphatase rdgB [Weeksella virosa DSM 16922]MDK7674758.1 RdgB/HAM1 family non-canonical purine NTP pyrophosphatase [Weeksella virosa]SUP54600.1 Non-canonical purine NTP pyrophosphatase [Weeksella virosa]VEH64076.1 Non-canonical purine NTP pyrophosphatase [Weeksella virosa]
MELIFATHNQDKLKELQALLPETIQLQSLTDLNFHDDIEETGNTFEENAFIKTKTIYEKFHQPVFADDSGLVIDALNGRPGVFSARYAGTKNSEDNIAKVLKELEGISNRKAYFISVFCLMINDEVHYFEGRIEGEIMNENKGNKGFGYDPIFRPSGFDYTFAEMSAEEKNAISHRSIATQKLIHYITENL